MNRVNIVSMNEHSEYSIMMRFNEYSEYSFNELIE